jgi:hypothetical protein
MPFAQTATDTGADVPGEISPFGLPQSGPMGPIPLLPQSQGFFYGVGQGVGQGIGAGIGAGQGIVGGIGAGIGTGVSNLENFVLLALGIWAAAYILPSLLEREW